MAAVCGVDEARGELHREPPAHGGRQDGAAEHSVQVRLVLPGNVARMRKQTAATSNLTYALYLVSCG